MKRSRAALAVATMLLPLASCAPEPEVVIPENPAPPPMKDPQPLGASSQSAETSNQPGSSDAEGAE